MHPHGLHVLPLTHKCFQKKQRILHSTETSTDEESEAMQTEFPLQISAEFGTVVTCLLPPRVVVVLDGSCNDRVVMSVADSVQLNLHVISCECVSEMTSGVGHEPAAFAVLVQPRIVGSSKPVNVIICTAVVSGSVSNSSQSSEGCILTHMSESLSSRALNCSVTLL
jgi:hypothetical protein